MITSQKASQIILSTIQDFGTEIMPTLKSYGRIVAQDILSDRPFPPFDRICMDGIAIDHKAFANGQRTFTIDGVQAAGSPQLTLSSADRAIEVMTGAMMPRGTTTVIRYEDLKRLDDDRFEIQIEVKDQANIHFKGEDQETDTVLLKKGAQIRSAEIALCATVGYEEIQVRSLPKVAILSTGNELVEIGEKPEPYQIRRSNVYMLKVQLESYGLTPETFHIPDDPEKISATLEKVLSEYDVLLMSGGVSKGKFDHIPDVLADLGVQKCFHRVSQRPGKPFWFGTKDRTVVFAFPGNPVSTLVGCLKYFKPWLQKSLGCVEQSPWVKLRSDFEFKPDLTYFAQAKLYYEPDGMQGEIIKGNGSGDMVSLSLVDGFVELPKGRDHFKAGEAFPFISM